LLGTTTANVTTGAWSVTPSAALTEGGHSLVAFATDTAGNESADFAVLQLTVDTTPPDTTAPAAPVFTTASGTVGTATPTLTGTAEAGSMVTLFDSSTLLGTTIVGAGGAWSFTPSAPLANGPHYFVATATDAAGNVSFPAICVLQIQAVSATYATWATANFTAAELADSAISGATSDPDGAGLTNLLRYALDLPARGPVSATTTAAFDGTTTPATLALSFTIRASADDLLYEVQSSEDLATWGPALADSKSIYTTSGTKRLELTSVPVPAGAKRFFLRLRVTQVP
jgi:hypothetical protein